MTQIYDYKMRSRIFQDKHPQLYEEGKWDEIGKNYVSDGICLVLKRVYVDPVKVNKKRKIRDYSNKIIHYCFFPDSHGYLRNDDTVSLYGHLEIYSGPSESQVMLSSRSYTLASWDSILKGWKITTDIPYVFLFGKNNLI